MKKGVSDKSQNLQDSRYVKTVYENDFVIFLVDYSNGNIQYVSQGVEDLLGYPVHYFYNQHAFSDLIVSISKKGKSDKTPFKNLVFQLHENEVNLIHKSGKEIGVTCVVQDLSQLGSNSPWVEVKVVANVPSMSDLLATGEVFGMEDELKDLKIPVPAFVNASSQALFITKNGICIGQNQQAADFFGYTEEEVKGLNPIDVIDEAYHEIVVENITKRISKPYEIKAKPKQGEPFFARIQGSTIDYQGNVIRLSAISKVGNGKDSDTIIQTHEKFLSLKNKELESQTNFLTTVNEFAVQMNTVHTEDCVLAMLLEILENKFNIHDSVIFRFNPYNNELAEFIPENEKSLREPFVISGFNGIVGSCAKQLTPILIGDTTQDERYIFHESDCRSELAVPLLVQENLYAVIDTEHKNENYFTHTHLEVMNALAAMASSRIQDILGQKQMKESEMKHRLLFETANDAIFISTEGKWTDCNPVALEMFECDSKMDLIGKSPFDFSPSHQPNGELSWEFGSKLKEEVTHGKPHFFEWIHKTKKGNSFHAHVSLNSFLLNGETYVQSVVRDISESVDVNKNLKDMAEMFSKLLDTTSAVAWEYDWTKGAYNYISSRIEKLSGYTREEWDEPFHWESIIHPEDKERVVGFGSKRIQLGEGYNHKYRMVKKDGSILWVRDLVSVVAENDANLLLRGCFIDITEQEEADKVKEELNTQLSLKVEELDQIKSDYQEVFEESRVPLFQDDYTDFIKDILILKGKVTTPEQLFTTYIEEFKQAVGKIKLIRANKACIKLFQASSSEELNQRILETITEKTKRGFAQIATGIMNGETEFKMENEFMGLKGRKVLTQVGLLIKPIPETKQIIGHVSMVDITLREQARSELARQNESLYQLSEQLSEKNELLIRNEIRYKALFYDSPVTLIEEDISGLLELVEGLKGKVHNIQAYMNEHPSFVSECVASLRTIRINKAGLRLFNVENEHELNEVMETTINRNGARIFKGIVMALFHKKTTATAQNEFVAKDGRIISSMVKYVLVPDSKRALLSIVDITELKNIEKELVSAKIKAEESDRLKTEFLNNLSHEIRTPLNGIIGFSNLISDPNLSPEEVEDHSNIIKGSGQQLIRIIDEIMEMSKLETNQVRTSQIEVDLTQVCEELYSVFNLKASEKGVELIFDIDIPNSETLVLIDKTKLLKILSNLVQNALKFTKKGFVKLLFEREDSYLKFSVVDTGIGIDEKNQNKIFSKFVQGDDSIATTYGGLGLGLSIVKNHVELLKGKINVISEVNQGSTFQVWLPYQSSGVKHKETPGFEEIEVPNNCTILVAEDDKINAMFLIHSLKRMDLNCDILHAKNGQQAVEMFSQHSNISLVLMDIGMPIMNGYEASKKIKEIDPYVPIIAQTAYTSSEDREKMKSVGMDDFMAKPIEPNILKQMLRDYLIKAKNHA